MIWHFDRAFNIYLNDAYVLLLIIKHLVILHKRFS